MKKGQSATPIDAFEKELQEFLDKGVFESATAEGLEKAKKMFLAAVKNTRELEKNKSITLRVRQEDLIRVKAKAAENNMPYQTLISLLIHQYVAVKRK